MISTFLAALNSLIVALRSGGVWHRCQRFYGLPILIRQPGARLEIGRRVVALSKPRLNEIGLIQPVVFSLLTPEAVIHIDDDAGLSGCTLSARREIRVGQGTMIGSGVLIMDHDAHALPLPGTHGSVAVKPVHIGREVFIGARAIILKGVTIGDHAVIGAGAVVTHDVPAHHVAVGNPARVVPPETE
ncbi:MAG: acyltransferase [Prosthecobacter sp.]|jgi:hypothetical protein|uniref:acyltransferase n=1 Tax=Prosthecobacter sp. TaxID=1965333 RepID=UPI0019EA55E4|nr:acyltransferase [Prosthecobacter sp.]MBE2283719.1 acyltransferase [Prosthecobacter sp.]